MVNGGKRMAEGQHQKDAVSPSVENEEIPGPPMMEGHEALIDPACPKMGPFFAAFTDDPHMMALLNKLHKGKNKRLTFEDVKEALHKLGEDEEKIERMEGRIKKWLTQGLALGALALTAVAGLVVAVVVLTQQLEVGGGGVVKGKNGEVAAVGQVTVAYNSVDALLTAPTETLQNLETINLVTSANREDLFHVASVSRLSDKTRMMIKFESGDALLLGMCAPPSQDRCNVFYDAKTMLRATPAWENVRLNGTAATAAGRQLQSLASTNVAQLAVSVCDKVAEANRTLVVAKGLFEQVTSYIPMVQEAIKTAEDVTEQAQGMCNLKDRYLNMAQTALNVAKSSATARQVLFLLLLNLVFF